MAVVEETVLAAAGGGGGSSTGRSRVCEVNLNLASGNVNKGEFLAKLLFKLLENL